MTAPTLSLAEWAALHQRITTADVDGHIHAGLRSMPTTKTFARRYEKRLRELQDARDATVADYRASVARGDIVEPARQSIAEVAAGEGPRAEACRRVLAKRAARVAAMRTEGA